MDMEEEIWKPVVGFEGIYSVSSHGRIRTHKLLKEGRVMKQGLDNKGYPQITLCVNSRKRTAKIHRLIAFAFIPNPDNKPNINHIDANPNNNKLENLEWCTQKENLQHASKLGRMKRSEKSIIELIRRNSARKGSMCGPAKVTEAQVMEIRAKYIPRIYSLRMLGKEYGINQATIFAIIKRDTWTHI